MSDIGTTIAGKYRLLRLLGDGGMGTVYEASHTLLGTRVAVKLLHREMLQRSGLVERFLQEAQVAAQIRSPHVVHMLDVGQESGQAPYLVMELLEGEPLSSVLEREQRVSEPRAVEYTVQILTALEAAHALGVIHRDLKPENVFITVAAGRPLIKLIDFGIAKLRTTDPGAKNLTVAGTVMGTAEYMAPEQAIRADQVDGRADLYSVGVMLYEMIAGVRPIVSDDPRALFTLAERAAIRPLTEYGSPPALAELVRRALQFRPEERFANATEFRLALEAIRATAPLPPIARPAPAADGSDLGAGTMMGAPVPQALALTGQLPRKTNVSPQHTGYEAHGQPAPRPMGTQMAPPVQQQGWQPPQAPQGPVYPAPNQNYRPQGAPPPGQAQPQPQYQSSHPLPRSAGTPRKKGSAGTIVAVVFVLLLLGGGAAAAVFYADSGDPPVPPPPVSTQPVETPSAQTTAVAADSHAGALGPLAPASGAAPAVPNNNNPGPSRPAASASTKPSTQPPIIPPLFPSGLPPLPSGFPTGLPQIPGLPSGGFPWLPPGQ